MARLNAFEIRTGWEESLLRIEPKARTGRTDDSDDLHLKQLAKKRNGITLSIFRARPSPSTRTWLPEDSQSRASGVFKVDDAMQVIS